MNEQRTSKTWVWLVCGLIIAGFAAGCESKRDTYVGKVLVNGVGDKATVRLNLVNTTESGGPPRSPSHMVRMSTASTSMAILR